MQLDDLDWDQETLRVRRSKVGRTDLYPLSRGVGQAIVRYLVEARPLWPDRSLFLTSCARDERYAPRLSRGSSDGGWTVLVSRPGAAGAHGLRHAAAHISSTRVCR